MPIESMKLEAERVVRVRLTGTLTTADYQQYTPQLDAWLQQHGRLRLLVEMHDFHGWDAGGLWQDIKLDARHFNHFEQIAMVGESRWQKWMAAFCRPFTTARIRYFTHDRLEKAQEWLGMSELESSSLAA